MDRHTLAQQAAVEDQALHHVMQALRAALTWEVAERGVGRKLSSVRFMTQSLERHLHRLIALEEDGGYMQVVTECKPNLAEKVAPLRADHDRFEATLDQLMGDLKVIDQDAPSTRLNEVCGRLERLLDDIARHHRAEAALEQQVLLEDEGGEG